MFKTEHIKAVLDEIANGSKQYLKVPKRSLDSGEYLEQLWVARSNKILAREKLISDSSEFAINATDIITFFVKRNLLSRVDIEDGDYKGKHLLALPTALEFLKILESVDEVELDESLIDGLIQQANNIFYQVSLEEMVKVVQEPLVDSETMTAKAVIFCWFLLLTGAISRGSAFILRKEDDKEYHLQSDIVNYLDQLSARIFPDSYNSKKGKTFKKGDLSNFIRRSKEIKSAFGDAIQIEDSAGVNLFYFNAFTENKEFDSKALERVIGITLSRLKHFAYDGDNINKTVMDTINWYRIDCPIKQSHMASLYVGKPPEDYYSQFEYYVYENLYIFNDDEVS